MSEITARATETADTTVVVPRDDVDSPDALAREVRAFIARFWLPPTQAMLDLVTVWILGTHARGRNADPFLPESFPLLCFGSTGPGSGKSTALAMVARLSSRGELLADPTAPALLTKVETRRITACIDEYDTMIGNGAGSRNLRSHVLTSYTAGGVVSRAVQGDTRDVDVHFPIAYAGMLRVIMTHPTLAAQRSRTLFVHCVKRQGQDIEVERYRRRFDGIATALQSVMAAWGLNVGPTIAHRAEYLELPADVMNRDAELWEPLFAVAECLGGDWSDRIHAACREIMGDGTNNEDDMPRTPVEWLLRDLAHVFGQTPRMTSAAVVEGLVNLPGSPWTRWLSADPSAPAVSGGKHLAAMLSEREVKPVVLKIAGKAERGYRRDDLIAAGMPDLPPAPADDDAPAPAVKRPARKRNPGPKAAPRT